MRMEHEIHSLRLKYTKDCFLWGFEVSESEFAVTISGFANMGDNY